MATIYVDDTATGANDGTSFADAFTSLASASVAVAGDIVLIASTHDELVDFDFGTNLATDGEINYISVNSGTEAFEAGASINSNVNYDFDNSRVFGMDITCNAARDIDVSNDRRGYWEQCTIDFDRFISTGCAEMRDCTINMRSSQGLFNQSDLMRIIGGSITATPSAAGTALCQVQDGEVELIGVDLSGIAYESLLVTTNPAREVLLKLYGCQIPANQQLIGSTDVAARVLLVNCTDGTLTDPTIEYQYEDGKSLCSIDKTVTRTDGASDGTTSYTMQLTAKANKTLKDIQPATYGPEPISVKVPEGATNISLHVAHNGVGSGAAGALQNNEFGFVYVGPSEAATATAQVAYKKTSPGFGVTPTDLPTDASVWSGGNVGTVQRVDLTIAPTEEGYAEIWPFLGTGSVSDVSIHFDPKIEIT